MGKTYVRVDDRLIHGQTIVAWAPTLGIQEIVGVDDVSAKNAMLKSIMTMSVPKTYKTHIVTTDEAKTILEKETEKTRLVIVKIPHELLALKDQIKGCEEIYLGNLAKKPDSTHQMTGATGIFYLSEQDIQDIDSLVSEGFKVTFQQVPSAAGVDWSSFKKTL
ncbi:MAG: PTS sugar transporter subunit IIB [Solobacterium sp.]|jgi:mannose/fructose/N-acetylgalactosamine-specific phosphotransferase system component IIB|nr:PTS sugar transporter subunit IIB [Solobacterium sp.]MCH4222470.1 PTS sugar transporter subunit IIB [Solobacterium sp.]MCH4266094.1 PTS sugar transporter subunit IIB [Solobacterium sp.]